MSHAVGWSGRGGLVRWVCREAGAGWRVGGRCVLPEEALDDMLRSLTSFMIFTVGMGVVECKHKHERILVRVERVELSS